MKWTNDRDRTIWLVRHGESTWNALRLIQGQADGSTLTERGRQQSVRIADHLRGRGVEAIYASDLERAQETASIIGAALGLPVGTADAVRERCFGTHEGRPSSTLGTVDSGISGDHVVDPSARPEGGESLDDLYQRVGVFFEWLSQQHPSGNVVVVTHGGTIRAMRAFCTGVSMRDAPWDVVPNGSAWNVRLPAAAVKSHS